MNIKKLEQEFLKIKKEFQLVKIEYKNLNNYCKASNLNLFLFLDKDNPFESIYYHRDKSIAYHSYVLFKIPQKIWHPCLKNFNIDCPLCEIDNHLINLYYLKCWEYEKNNLTGLTSFKRPGFIYFYSLNEIISFVQILKVLGDEINYIIYGFDVIEQKPVLKLPNEETINLAKQLVIDYPIEKLYSKLFHPAIITDFSKEGLTRLQFRYNRIKDRFLMSEKVSREFKNEEN